MFNRFKNYYLEKINVYATALWILIVIYTCFSFSLRFFGYDVETYLFIIIVTLSIFSLFMTNVSTLKNFVAIVCIILALALINSFSAFANIGNTSLKKMIFNGSIRLPGYFAVALALHEINRITNKKKQWLIIASSVGLLQSILSIIFIFLGKENAYGIFISPMKVDEIIKYRTTGLFNNSVYFSILLVTTILITLFLLMRELKEFKQREIGTKEKLSNPKLWLYAASIIIQISALIVTYCYFSIFVLVVLVAVLILSCLKTKVRYIIIVLFIIIIIVIFTPVLRMGIAQDLGITGKIVEGQFNDKNIYAAMDVGMGNSIYGIGNNNYDETIIQLNKGIYPYTPFSASSVAPNSSMLIVFAENGIISVVGYLGLILIMLYVSLKKYGRYIRSEQKMICSSSLSVVLTIALALFMLFTPIMTNYALMLLYFVVIISSFFEREKKQDSHKLFKLWYGLFCLIVAICVIIIGIYYKNMDNKYGPIMEKQRKGLYISTIEMEENIERNLSILLYDNEINVDKFEEYSSVLDNYVTVVQSYINEPESRFYKCRAFKDLFAHLSDLNDISNNFSTGSAIAFFEITLPVHIYNYTSEDVKLPMYSYEMHKFEDLTELGLIYYIDRGYNINPMQSIRNAETEYLLQGKYEEFKKIHKVIASLLDVKEYNGNDYLQAAYYFKYRDYDVPWYSGMAQGVLIEISAKAYQMTGDEYYREFIERLMPAFYIDYEDGGIMYHDEEYDLPFVLEYTVTEEDRELNGCIIAALGLREWYITSGDEKALALYRDIMQDVIYRLDDYNFEEEDMPEGASWSKYSLTVFPVQKSYHMLHLNLLHALKTDKIICDLDGFEKIEYYLDRWTKGFEYRYPNEDVSSLFNVVLPNRE